MEVVDATGLALLPDQYSIRAALSPTAVTRECCAAPKHISLRVVGEVMGGRLGHVDRAAQSSVLQFSHLYLACIDVDSGGAQVSRRQSPKF